MKNISFRKRQLKNGFAWEYRFDTAIIDGKRQQQSKGGFKTKKDAEIAGKEAYEKYHIFGKVAIVSSDISATDFIMNDWFEYKKRTAQWQKTTIDNNYKRIKNYILPVIGKSRIDSVSSQSLQKLLDDLYFPENGLCYNTVSNLHSTLVSIFKYAIMQRYITNSPMKYVIIPKRKENESSLPNLHQKRDSIPDEIINEIFEIFPEGTAPYIPMKISLLTGARLGEVFGLCWEDVDFEKNTITICRQMQEAKETYICNPKYNSSRVVPMCSELKELLLRTKEIQEKNKEEFGEFYEKVYATKVKYTNNSNTHNVCNLSYDSGETEMHFINLRPDGQVISPNVMKHTSRIIHGYSANKKIKEKISENDEEHPYIYPEFNVHSLRHTYATKLRTKGIQETIISELLGHKGIYVTKRYMHITDTDIDNVKSKLDEK